MTSAHSSLWTLPVCLSSPPSRRWVPVGVTSPHRCGGQRCCNCGRNQRCRNSCCAANQHWACLISSAVQLPGSMIGRVCRPWCAAGAGSCTVATCTSVYPCCTAAQLPCSWLMPLPWPSGGQPLRGGPVRRGGALLQCSAAHSGGWTWRSRSSRAGLMCAAGMWPPPGSQQGSTAACVWLRLR